MYDEFNRTFDSVPHNRLCVPYSGKGMPVSGYEFSNIFMTLILTFKTYDEMDNRLRYEDIQYIMMYRMILNWIKYGMNNTDAYFNKLVGSHEMNRWIDILDSMGSYDGEVESRTINAYHRYQILNLGDMMRRMIPII